MSPPFLCRIDEIEESADAHHNVDNHGIWTPSTDPGSHTPVGGGISGRIWYCDTQRIYEISQLPSTAGPFKQFSVYYVAGRGFWILRGNALIPRDDENWHALSFTHSDQDYSSYLTNAGDQARIRTQRPDQTWLPLLLPDIYHAQTETANQQYGGITGELPILLALVAFSTTREHLLGIFPYFFTGGVWQLHQSYFENRTNQRGVVVTVWTCPSSYAGGSTSEDLESYEEGVYGKYFH